MLLPTIKSGIEPKGLFNLSLDNLELFLLIDPVLLGIDKFPELPLSPRGLILELRSGTLLVVLGCLASKTGLYGTDRVCSSGIGLSREVLSAFILSCLSLSFGMFSFLIRFLFLGF